MVTERNRAGKTLGVCAEAGTGFWEIALAIRSPAAGDFPGSRQSFAGTENPWSGGQ